MSIGQKIAREVCTRMRKFTTQPLQGPWLIVILVAECRTSGVENVANADIRAETIHVDLGVECQGMTSRISTVDTRHTGIASVVLPDAEVTIDETVVLFRGQQRLDNGIRC